MGVVEFKLDKLPNFNVISDRMRKAMGAACRNWSTAFLNVLVTTRLSGRPGVNRVTGNLSRDWVVDITTDPDIAVTIKTQGVANAYAGVQEGKDGQDTIIRPVKSKYLWIPLHANRAANGAARISPTEAIQRGGFISWKYGPVFFARPVTKARTNRFLKATGGNVALFVLKKEVRIPARMGAGNLFRSMLPGLSQQIATAAAEGWQK